MKSPGKAPSEWEPTHVMLTGLDGMEARRFQLGCEICFWGVDLANGTCQVGPGWESWLGEEEGSASVRLSDWLDRFHPVDRAEMDALLHQPRARRPVALEVRMKHSDGGWRWLRLKGQALEGTQSFVGFAEEITRQKGRIVRAEERRKAAEEALRRSEELYRGLYEQTTEHLFSVTVDREGTFRYEGLNPAHQRATGLRESDLRGKRPHECLPQAVADHVEANYRRCLQSQRVIAYEEELDLPNGRINWLTQLIPLRHPDGSVARLFGICTDLTRLKEQEKALRLAQRKESIGRLTSGIAHDFNNLLTVILCQLDLMQAEMTCNPEMSELLGEIGEAAWHAAELTRGLLTYSAQPEGNRAPQPVAELVRRFQRVLKNLIGPGIELIYELESGACVMGAPLQINQLLLNLVGNASEAIGGAGGKIWVRLGEQTLSSGACESLLPGQGVQAGDFVTLEISDDGPGMEEDTVASIFEAGFSLKGEGRGLGLATVREIVRLMQGGLFVRSQPGQGTSFKLFFPVVAASPPAASAPAPESTEELHGHVMFCSGETSVRRTLKELCLSLGLSSQETTDPAELLTVLARTPEPVELVILDVPDQATQDQVLLALPALRPAVKVLVLSHLPAGELLLTRLYAPPSAFLNKPFQKRDFEACLRRLLSPG